MSTFQVILTTIFGFFIIGALLLFATSKGGNTAQIPAITIWGTVASGPFMEAVNDLNQTIPNKLTITYVEKREQDFDQALTEALASGTGPDAVIFPHTSLIRQQSRLFVIPPASYSLRAFKDSFIDESGLYLNSAGILALPMSVDPLVMYWNKDIFSTAGVASPPKTWDQYFALAQKLTVKDKVGNITQSAVALGEFANIVNAKDILSALFLQAGTPIVSYNATDDRLQAVLDQSFGQTLPPAEAVLRFYTEFSNPAKTTYSWNRSQKNSQTLFIGGDLAVYFGFASELPVIEKKNPNLNFDVAALPQPLDVKTQVNYGKLTGFGIMKSSQKIAGVFQVGNLLTSADFVRAWVTRGGITPARRDVLSERPADPSAEVFYKSALMSRGWPDSDAVASAGVFKRMVESVTSGQERPSEAVSGATQELQSLIQ